MSDILKDFAVKSLNITDEQFAEIVYSDDKQTIKENAIEELLRIDAERINNAKKLSKERETELHDKGYKKAQAESLSKFEKDLKDEFGVSESTSQGKDLVKEIIAKITKDTNLPDDKVKLHPLYVQLERKLGSEYVAKAEYDKVIGEFDGYKNQIVKDKVLNVIKTDGASIFRSLKPVLSKDPAKALNQELDFLGKLSSYEYELQEDGNHIIKVDGKRIETPQGYPVKFSDFVKDQAGKLYDFEVQGQRQNAGNQGGGSNFKLPTTKEEYTKAMANATSSEERMLLLAHWDSVLKNK